jgi:hypothetical protein
VAPGLNRSTGVACFLKREMVWIFSLFRFVWQNSSDIYPSFLLISTAVPL